MRYYITSISILIVLALSACSNNEQNELALLLPEDNFINMMAEIHLAEATIKISTQTKNKDFPFDLKYLYGTIYDKYDFSEAELNTQLTELAAHPKEMKRLFAKVEKRLKEMQTAFKE